MSGYYIGIILLLSQQYLSAVYVGLMIRSPFSYAVFQDSCKSIALKMDMNSLKMNINPMKMDIYSSFSKQNVTEYGENVHIQDENQSIDKSSCSID